VAALSGVVVGASRIVGCVGGVDGDGAAWPDGACVPAAVCPPTAAAAAVNSHAPIVQTT
jgi:hypothetical protein